MDTTSYDTLIKSLMFTDIEVLNLNRVREGIEADSKTSPFITKEWATKFKQSNADGVALKDAPINQYLIVTSESLGTIYRNDRGTGLLRGSVIVKLSDTLIYCIEARYWYASPSGNAITFSQHGYFETSSESSNGAVKMLSEIDV